MKPKKHDHRQEAQTSTAFQGYAAPTSSTTYTPNQFFDVVLPNASRGCLRLVGYLIRKTLGWSDEHGNPRNPEAHVSYKELIQDAGISRGAIKDAIQEALDKKFVQCLRFGQPHRPNEEGFSALYSLKWDETEKYITNPDEFQGFFAGNGNLTHIPNEFFDYTVPREPLAVVQVIGVVIRTSIGWQSKFGFRRQQTELSFSEIMRRTGINSRTTVSNAIKSALEGNHIRRVESGVFDPNAGVQSKAAVYSIRWNDDNRLPEPPQRTLDEPQPSLFLEDVEDGSKSGPKGPTKKRTGKRSVQKVDRSSTVQKVDWEDIPESGPGEGSKNEPETVQKLDCLGFKNRTDIETTIINNKLKQQQTQEDRVVVGTGIPLVLLIGKLMAEGIEANRAASLVDNYPHELIQRQIEALPTRRITKNRAGFLIRAIEIDMPVADATKTKVPFETEFASYFYAELGGNEGDPVSHVGPVDEEAAVAIWSRMAKGTSAKTSGRSFGKYVKKRQQGAKYPVRTLSLAVRSFGDEFVASLAVQQEAERRLTMQTARQQHERDHEDKYRSFLSGLYQRLSECKPGTTEAFAKWIHAKLEKRRKMSETAYRNSARLLATEEGKTSFFVDFLSETLPELVPSFWEWDEKHNPDRFSKDGENV